MKKIKPNFYSKAEIDKTKCEIRIILGARHIGKSYDVKLDGLQCGLHGKPFVLLRRWKTDLESGGAVGYFKDLKREDIMKLTDNMYNEIEFKTSEFKFIYRNEQNVIEKRSDVIGYGLALTDYAHVKSRQYLEPCFFILEEMMTETYYIPNEIDAFNSIVDTIARGKLVTIYMIGNMNDRINNIYIRHFGLANVCRQKPGTIETYTFNDKYGSKTVRTIAVEISAIHDPDGRTKDRASVNAKVNWNVHAIAEEPEVIQTKNYCIVYKGIATYLIQFKIYGKAHIRGLYIQPKTSRVQKDTRVVCKSINELDVNERAVVGFARLPERELNIFNRHRSAIYFSDPITAEDWQHENISV